MYSTSSSLFPMVTLLPYPYEYNVFPVQPLLLLIPLYAPCTLSYISQLACLINAYFSLHWCPQAQYYSCFSSLDSSFSLFMLIFSFSFHSSSVSIPFPLKKNPLSVRTWLPKGSGAVLTLLSIQATHPEICHCRVR